MVLVVVSIALGIALPSLRDFAATNQVHSASSSIVSGLNFARFSAITTGEDITICPSANGESCSDGNWHANWIVFNDFDANSDASAGEIIRVAGLEAEVDASGFNQAIVFQSTGRTTLNGNAVITTCSGRGEHSINCADITVSVFGAIETAKRDVAIGS